MFQIIVPLAFVDFFASLGIEFDSCALAKVVLPFTLVSFDTFSVVE
jgi:hypothetical protein